MKSIFGAKTTPLISFPSNKNRSITHVHPFLEMKQSATDDTTLQDAQRRQHQHREVLCLLVASFQLNRRKSEYVIYTLPLERLRRSPYLGALLHCSCNLNLSLLVAAKEIEERVDARLPPNGDETTDTLSDAF